ncbi:CCN family member 2 isoform X2 [Anthonomus grandis grandis]|uniref:CCN family member 2 isoform X2 n=1 Tax=Anthonomus grandis grandis TaxID=2921223 RepID=UPI00216533CB|nr:CCN family member 2 isoform X2 [Anthonomus grandis grandis]
MVYRSVILLGFLSVAPIARGVGPRKRETDETVLFEAPANEDTLYPCPNPCSCPPKEGDCTDCGPCPRQLGEPCNEENRCDLQKGLICRYRHGDNDGICRESSGVPCVVYNKSYDHGETFNLDCRTQCVCQNGTYGCSSLCPQEHISPSECQNPRLVDVAGQCCREWMCDSRTEQPPSCQPSFSRWSLCSSECGSGLSSRKSNLNAKCVPDTEIRICQTRRCQDKDYVEAHRKHHHLRKGHECKATHRLSEPVFLRFGPCRSRKRFRPKYCGLCPMAGMSCEPTLSTTVNVDFICEGPGAPAEKPTDLLPEYFEPGADFWADEFPPKYDSDDSRLLTVLVQWVLKCRCAPEPTEQSVQPEAKVVHHRVHRT